MPESDIPDSYRKTVRSLGISIALQELLIALGALLLVFALQNSLDFLTIVRAFQARFGEGLWLGWVVVALSFIAAGWTEFVFIRRARAMFADTANPITVFGESCDDEAKSLEQVRRSLNRYLLVALPVSLLLALFMGMALINVVLAGLLIALQLATLFFLRDKARLLRADKQLLT